MELDAELSAAATEPNLNICRFCAKEDVKMMATACTPNSSIAMLFEKVTNIKVRHHKFTLQIN